MCTQGSRHASRQRLDLHRPRRIRRRKRCAPAAFEDRRIPPAHTPPSPSPPNRGKLAQQCVSMWCNDAARIGTGRRLGAWPRRRP
ncbi:hypothetical protein I546_2784 [Mycobacterium kansasii 732]|nr:hypothetical protein I546_2784 [Mycobacterium kansasii 732]